MADKVFKQLPKMHTTYANIIKSMIPVGNKPATQLPTCVYRVEKLAINEHNLQEYRHICGFIDDGKVPITYFAVLSQTLQMNLMATEEFPFAMLGLVHIANSTTQHRPIFDSETVSMSVHLDNLANHDKGQQFDFITKVTIGDELVWQGISTYLSRQKSPKNTTNIPKSEPLADSWHPTGQPLATFMAAEDIGRQYALISGDFNLIHLHPLSAKAFGFPKAIAHGMWSKARSLAHFHHLPKAYRVDVLFKAPIFLPSKVELFSTETKTGYDFGVYSNHAQKTHLIGTITPINKKETA